MTNEDAAFYQIIDEILWNDWDPIGVNTFPEARDEYYMYLPNIFSLKKAKADKETIAQHLFRIISERMGLNGNIEHCRAIADKILRA
jgi:hypothetical protein